MMSSSRNEDEVASSALSPGIVASEPSSSVTTSSTSTSTASSTTTNTSEIQFAIGDHVFTWCSYLGVPFAYQEHGIVVAGPNNFSDKGNAENAFNEDENEIVILNFDHQPENEISEQGEEANDTVSQAVPSTSAVGSDDSTPTPTSADQVTAEDNRSTFSKNMDFLHDQAAQTIQQAQTCCTMTPLRMTQKQAAAKWEHVQYNQTEWHKRLSQRAGTCTPDSSDPVPVILYRIQFLQQNPHLLSNLIYDAHKRNGECIATWCKTGQYKSAAGSAKMGEAGMHIGTFTLAGGLAAQLAASAVVPVLLPFMAAMDVGQAIVQGKDLLQAKTEWNERTAEWNELFEEYLSIVVEQRQLQGQQQRESNGTANPQL